MASCYRSDMGLGEGSKRSDGKRRRRKEAEAVVGGGGRDGAGVEEWY